MNFLKLLCCLLAISEISSDYPAVALKAITGIVKPVFEGATTFVKTLYKRGGDKKKTENEKEREKEKSAEKEAVKAKEGQNLLGSSETSKTNSTQSSSSSSEPKKYSIKWYDPFGLVGKIKKITTGRKTKKSQSSTKPVSKTPKKDSKNEQTNTPPTSSNTTTTIITSSIPVTPVTPSTLSFPVTPFNPSSPIINIPLTGPVPPILSTPSTQYIGSGNSDITSVGSTTTIENFSTLETSNEDKSVEKSEISR